MPFRGKVIALRLWKKVWTPSNSAITHHGSDVAVPADHPNVFKPLPSLPSESSPEYTVPARSEPPPGISDALQLGLSVMEGAAGLIPTAGGPLNAAISGLLTILQTVNMNTRNRAAIVNLKDQLHRLSQLLDTPTAKLVLQESRRDDIIGVLEDTSDELKKLDKRFFGYQSVTHTVTGCSVELDHYLEEIQLAALQEEVELRVQQFNGPVATGLPRTFLFRCVILADATGHEHRIPMEFSTSFEQLKNMLKVLFAPDSNMARIQRQFVEQGEYDLCIDQETQVTELTSEADEWSGIEAGTKIIMRVIITKQVRSNSVIRCDACGSLDLSMTSAGVNIMDCWTVCCQGCGRRYQISIPQRRKLTSSGSSVGGRGTEPTMMQDIRNMHIREIPFESRITYFTLREIQEVHNFIIQAAHIMLTGLIPPPTLRKENPEKFPKKRKDSDLEDIKKRSDSNPNLFPNPSEKKSEEKENSSLNKQYWPRQATPSAEHDYEHERGETQAAFTISMPYSCASLCRVMPYCI